MYRVIYSSNNSGGSWWLEDKNWLALEKAGWTVHWADSNSKKLGRNDTRGYNFDTCLDKTTSYDKDCTWLGACATSAAKEFDSLDEAVEEFNRVADQNATDQGCNCCGPPHGFSYKNMETGKTGYGSGYVKETSFSWH